MEQSREKRKLPVPALAGIIAAVVIVILIGAYCGLCKWVQDNGRLLPGAQAQDSTGAVVLDLGGVNQQDAVSQLSAYMEKHLEGRTLTLGDSVPVTRLTCRDRRLTSSETIRR